VVKVAITVDQQARTARVDFTGTSDQVPTNFNAPASICRAAALYVFRTLVDDEIPMNDGCLRPVELVIPEGSMLRPRYPAAVVAGNVETSQVVVDALYGALGVMAGAQGTMNNFTFGDERRQYYETICGGSGAGPDLRRRRRRPDPHDQQPPDRSGGAGDALSGAGRGLLDPARFGRGGAHRGGDGVVRRIGFREPMTATLLSNRRRVPPFGLAGGEPGALGKARVERADGSVQAMAATDLVEVAAGDSIVIETPGGGGWGRA
jgi:5-oxoprolinase (ATP-hydrolysing)